MISIALHRLAAELACLAGVAAAAVLAYADKSPWVWSWFLIFAAFNIVTGVKETKTTETTSTTRPASADS